MAVKIGKTQIKYNTKQKVCIVCEWLAADKPWENAAISGIEAISGQWNAPPVHTLGEMAILVCYFVWI